MQPSQFTATHNVTLAENFHLDAVESGENSPYLRAWFRPYTQVARDLFQDIFVVFDPATGVIVEVDPESVTGEIYNVTLSASDEQFIRDQIYARVGGGG